jgi:hypothetical protein
MGTPGGRVAGIVGAGVAVVAVRRCSADAGSSGTGVIRSAGIAVVAGIGIVVMGTPGGRVARIIGADVSVITVEGTGSRTDPRLTAVHSVAGISVIACTAVRLKVTKRVAAIAVLGIAVVAVLARVHVTVSAMGSSRACRCRGFPAVLLTHFIPVADQISADAAEAVHRTGDGVLLTVTNEIPAVTVLAGIRIFRAGIAGQVAAKTAILWTGQGVFTRLAKRISAELGLNDGGQDQKKDGDKEKTYR